MKLYWIKTHSIIKKLFNGFVWDIKNNEKKVFLTFDDGPIPEVTEWVLDILEQYNIKATFFCIGHNINTNPDIFKKIIDAGHAIGNHTYNHLHGWKTNNKEYIDNCTACRNEIDKYYPKGSAKLFRPPYGEVKPAQAKRLRHEGYKLIMWDVLSADFDRGITPQQCLDNVINNTRSGSIIIFHDSIKAFDNLKYALPKAIEYLKKQQFVFDKIA